MGEVYLRWQAEQPYGVCEGGAALWPASSAFQSCNLQPSNRLDIMLHESQNMGRQRRIMHAWKSRSSCQMISRSIRTRGGRLWRLWSWKGTGPERFLIIRQANCWDSRALRLTVS